MCCEKTHTHCNGQASIYLYTKLTKFVARNINLREVAIQLIGGLVPCNFNANIDADLFRKIGPKSQDCISKIRYTRYILVFNIWEFISQQKLGSLIKTLGNWIVPDD